MQVVITDEAWSDILSIARYISRDNPNRAVTFANELRESCRALGSAPEAYPLLPTRPDDGIRRKPHGHYLIFYRVNRSNVEVLHVLHGMRDIDRILFPAP
jgi:toxin ParE1/3/4